MPKINKGSQAAKKGEKVDLATKTPKILSKKTKIKPREIPKARLIPIPPLLLKDETETAIIVKIKTDNGVVHLLYLTKRCSFIRIDPLTFSSLINLFKSKNVKVSAK